MNTKVNFFLSQHIQVELAMNMKSFFRAITEYMYSIIKYSLDLLLVLQQRNVSIIWSLSRKLNRRIDNWWVIVSHELALNGSYCSPFYWKLKIDALSAMFVKNSTLSETDCWGWKTVYFFIN